MLQAGTLSEESQRELKEAIYEEADRLNRLVTNLLGMTRLESGSLALARDWQSLEELVGTALARFDKGLKGRPVTVSIPDDLPLLPVDGVLIEQVLMNLVENALKYTEPGSPVLLVTARAVDGSVLVEVADEGPGLAPGDEERVFEKFYRAGAGQRGSGLGLPICRAVVTAHGGRIWARNRPPRGAAFCFTLPLGEARRRPWKPMPIRADAPGRDETVPRPLVLVVEDEPQVRRFLRATLSAHEYRLAEATTGQQGILEATTRSPDLILLDLGLPDLDGMEVTRRLREWSTTPLIVISARGQEGDKVQALDAGADDYLTKPFGAGELLARIRVGRRTRRGPATCRRRSAWATACARSERAGSPPQALTG